MIENGRFLFYLPLNNEFIVEQKVHENSYYNRQAAL